MKFLAVSALVASSVVDAKLRPQASQRIETKEIKEDGKEIKSISPELTYNYSPWHDQTHVRHVREPLVQDVDCNNQCLFNDDINKWCLSTTNPMLKAGWEVTQ